MYQRKEKNLQTSVISNPPYNIKWEYPPLAQMLPEYQGWTLPPKSNANYAFVLNALNKINDKAAFILPNGFLTSSEKSESALRKEFITKNLISAIIILPNDMFESTSIPTCVVLFDKKKQTKYIEMIDMRNCADKKIRKQRGQCGGASHVNRIYNKTINALSDEQIQRAVEAVEKRSNEAGYCKSVSFEEIKKENFTLSPSTYIGFKFDGIPHRPYKDIVDDYNRIVKQKNHIKITINETAAKRLGIPIDLYKTNVDLTDAFKKVNCVVEKEDFITSTKSAIIQIKIDIKKGIPYLIQDFLKGWALLERYLNDEQNRILAEFRDAILPDLMNGKIKLED